MFEACNVPCSPKEVGERLVDGLAENQKQILALVAGNPYISNAQNIKFIES